MLNKSKISVLCPCFNHEKFVGYFIQSLIAQIYDNWELLIVDDCSTDNSVDCINKFSDSRIKLIKQDYNQGPGVAWNKAYMESSGDYFIICASDDMLDAEYLSFLSKKFEEGEELIYSPLKVIDDKNLSHSVMCLPSSNDRIELLKHLFYKDNCLFSPGMAFNKRLAKVIFPTNVSMVQHQDYQWHVKLLLNTERVCFCNKPFVLYRKINNKASLSVFSKTEYNRTRLEIEELMNTFIHIKDTILVSQILNISDFCDENLIPYMFAIEGIKTNNYDKRQWGYRLLMSLYSNDEFRNCLHKLYDFSFKNLLRYSGNDYYNARDFNLLKIKFLIKKFIKGHY